ncbi:MAG: SPOR domain-containing protein [bacterium]|nr:MAG: SPOR domain-containing protein [bacterium]
MKRRISHIIAHSLIVTAFLCSFLYIGCTRSGVSRSVPAVEDTGRDIDRDTRDVERADTLDWTGHTYDLEDEMLEEDPIAESGESDREIEPVAADTFSVEDLAVEKSESSAYGIGFRVQVFATADLEKAKAVKERAGWDSGLPAHIEFEGGLYKVRVGDFASREEAAAARARLVELYPDCWIVSTTVRMTD